MGPAYLIDEVYIKSVSAYKFSFKFLAFIYSFLKFNYSIFFSPFQKFSKYKYTVSYFQKNFYSNTLYKLTSKRQ